jgi:hypothetical protein
VVLRLLPSNLQRRSTAWCVRRRFSTDRIVAQYDGTQRLLCPHVVGYNQPGEWRVFCYQLGGETNSGPRPDGGRGIWRCLSLKKLSGVKFMAGPWQGEPHARQRCVENIEVDAADYPGGDPQNGQ